MLGDFLISTYTLGWPPSLAVYSGQIKGIGIDVNKILVVTIASCQWEQTQLTLHPDGCTLIGFLRVPGW